MALMRTIGIVGRAFCGSTLLSKLFATVPGVASPGEVHWLVDDEPMSRCVVCGDGCAVLTPEFRDSLSEETLYEQVAARFGVDTLVSSDKTPWQYERFVQPKTMDAVLMVRSPHGIAASELHRQFYQPKESIRRSVLAYMTFYSMIMLWCESFARKTVVLIYEDLCEQPCDLMRALCTELQIPAAKIPLDLSTIEYHQVGGGRHTHEAQAIRLDDRWKKTLAQGQQRWISEHPIAMGIYDRFRETAIKPA
jgi:hypothetical protein